MRHLGAALGLLLVIPLVVLPPPAAVAEAWGDYTYGEWLKQSSVWGDGIVYGMLEFVLNDDFFAGPCSGPVSLMMVLAVLRTTSPIVEPTKPLTSPS